MTNLPPGKWVADAEIFAALWSLIIELEWPVDSHQSIWEPGSLSNTRVTCSMPGYRFYRRDYSLPRRWENKDGKGR